MATNLTRGERYTFARINDISVIVDSTDNVQTAKHFRNNVSITGSVHVTSTDSDFEILQTSPTTTTPTFTLKTTATATNDHLYQYFNHTSANWSMGIVHGSASTHNDAGFFIISNDDDIQTDASRVVLMDKAKNVFIPNGGLVLGGADDGSEADPADGQLIAKGGLQVFHSGVSATYEFTESSTSGYTTTFDMNNTGLSIGHSSSVRDIRFKTNSSARMTISSDGHVGINTTSPDKQLHIHDSGILIDGGSAHETGTGDAGLAPRFIIDSGASTAHQLCHMYSDTGINILLVKADGSIFMSELNTASSGGNNLKVHSGQLKEMTSTRKIKKNIEDLDSYFVDNFFKIRTVQFQHKSDDSPGFGFIAEEISKIHKNYATWGPDYARDEKGSKIRIGPKDYKMDSEKLAPTGIDETTILAAAVAKIQQLEKRIEELENK